MVVVVVVVMVVVVVVVVVVVMVVVVVVVVAAAVVVEAAAAVLLLLLPPTHNLFSVNQNRFLEALGAQHFQKRPHVVLALLLRFRGQATCRVGRECVSVSDSE